MQNLTIENSVQPMMIGVWHRPSAERESTLEGVIRVIEEFCSAGINTVFLEVFYHGVTFFKNNMVPYKPEFSDFNYCEYTDYLTAFVGEATKRGVKIHAWVQNFYVGVKEEAQFVTEHAAWLLKNQHGMIRHTTEGGGFGGYIFLDPANREVKDFLVEFYNEILTRFPEIKGLNLDYIRYPVSIFEEDTDTGYTEPCMRDFAEREGLSDEEIASAKLFNATIKEKGLLDICDRKILS